MIAQCSCVYGSHVCGGKRWCMRSVYAELALTTNYCSERDSTPRLASLQKHTNSFRPTDLRFRYHGHCYMSALFVLCTIELTGFHLAGAREPEKGRGRLETMPFSLSFALSFSTTTQNKESLSSFAIQFSIIYTYPNKNTLVHTRTHTHTHSNYMSSFNKGPR